MKSIKIGTRNSPLAIWQAKEVAGKLNRLNCETEIIPIVSTGDKNLDKPLYELGITGVFTKDLDVALLNNKIDIAVHSLKDVPTQLPKNIELLAYLERDFPQDVLVRRKNTENYPLNQLKIATSSLRRRAFWSKEFPDSEFVDIRGNVNTRLRKLEEDLADATIFSLAGIKRMNLEVSYEYLPFMISAPSQGVIAISGNTGNEGINSVVCELNHKETQLCVETEREFLKALEGGCTAPIGAFSEIHENKMSFVGRLCSPDGKKCVEINKIFNFEKDFNWGVTLAQEILNKGGKEIMSDFLRSR